MYEGVAQGRKGGALGHALTSGRCTATTLGQVSEYGQRGGRHDGDQKSEHFVQLPIIVAWLSVSE